jgi:hypothetical protein
MVDEFWFEKDFRINASIAWRFNLGKYNVIINDIVIPYHDATISFHEEFKGTYRLVVYDWEGHVLAFINASACEDWVFEISKYPQYHLYHLTIHKEFNPDYKSMGSEASSLGA